MLPYTVLRKPNTSPNFLVLKNVTTPRGQNVKIPGIIPNVVFFCFLTFIILYQSKNSIRKLPERRF